MDINKIIFDASGNFQWTSAVAFVALITAIISIFNVSRTNNSNFKGNVAKARIEWIQEVRKKSTDFISACYDVLDFMKSYDKRIPLLQQLDSEGKKEMARLKNEVRKNGTLLSLYFGPDSSNNNEIIDVMVSNLVERLTDKQMWEKREGIRYILNDLEAIKDFLRIYFKAEWKRSNGELKDSKLRNYLKKHSVYKSIYNIYTPEVIRRKRMNERYYWTLENKTINKEP